MPKSTARPINSRKNKLNSEKILIFHPHPNTHIVRLAKIMAKINYFCQLILLFSLFLLLFMNLLHFLVLFINLTILFQLTFSFSYDTFNRKISESQTNHRILGCVYIGQILFIYLFIFAIIYGYYYNFWYYFWFSLTHK